MLTPSLDNYYLDILKISDRFENALSVHEFPFTNKNSIENLGQKTRRITVECVFQQNPPLNKQPGDKFLPTYDRHYEFLKHIKAGNDSYRLTHPAYGELVGQISNANPRHDDTINYVEITFEFLEIFDEEQVTPAPFPSNSTSKDFVQQTADTLASINNSRKLTRNLTQWTATLVTSKAIFDAFLSNITSPANSIINTIHYATDTPSQYMYSVNSVIDRIIESHAAGRDVPASFLNSIIVGCRAFKATLTNTDDQDRVHIMAASRVAYEAATVYEDDDKRREELESKEKTPTFDISGNKTGEIEILTPAMTVTELEISLGEVRTFLNEAVEIDRNNRTLNNQAKILQDYVNKIKLERDRLLVKEYPLQTLHDIARKNGLSYQAAERLLKLNPSIKNPAFVEGDITISLPPPPQPPIPEGKGFIVGARGIQAGVKAFSGETGIQGPIGPQGVTGVQGIQGVTGVQGQTGVAGETGVQGIQGQTGVQGVQGIQGQTGVAGETGVQGIQGNTGVQGETGVQGTQGVTGVAGIQGETGVQGVQGNTGVQGETGVQGTQGDTGVAGIQGETGVEGVTGETGVQGTQGITGVGIQYWDRDAGNGYLYPSTLSDRVGIGTTTPRGSLEIYGTPDSTWGTSVIFDPNYNARPSKIEFKNAIYGNAYIGIDKDNLLLSDSSSYALVLAKESNYNVHIGRNNVSRIIIEANSTKIVDNLKVDGNISVGTSLDSNWSATLDTILELGTSTSTNPTIFAEGTGLFIANNIYNDGIYRRKTAGVSSLITAGASDWRLSWASTGAADQNISNLLYNRIEIDDTETTINEDSIDVDFRIESKDSTSALFFEGSSGRLGMNTITPSYALDVQRTGPSGDISLIRIINKDPTIRDGSPDNNAAYFAAEAGNGAVKTQFFSSYMSASLGQSGHVAVTTNHDLNLWTNNIRRITVKNDGKVGIGTTIPGSLLDINGSSNPELRLTSSGNYGQIRQYTSEQALKLGVKGIDVLTIDDGKLNFHDSTVISSIPNISYSCIYNSHDQVGDIPFDENGNLVLQCRTNDLNCKIVFITPSFGDKIRAIMDSTAMKIFGDLDITGELSKGSGTFKIDHPNDPYNKYMYHSFVESPEMRNVYYGRADTTDSTSVIGLPYWWMALNGDNTDEFTYNLTPIGSYSRLFVNKEIKNNEFEVVSLDGDCKFSWTISGIRHDKFAEEHRVQVEVDKSEFEKGTLRYEGKNG